MVEITFVYMFESVVQKVVYKRSCVSGLIGGRETSRGGNCAFTGALWEEFEICGAYEGKVNFLKFGKKLFFCRLLPTRPLQVCKIFMFV